MHLMLSRFPLGERDGRVPLSRERRSGRRTRPFGMRFAVDPPIVEAGKHSKPHSRNTKTKPTSYNKDGKTVPDSETYVEYD